MTVVKYTTDILQQYGLQKLTEPQQVANIWIYPWDYFCPMMYQTGELNLTGNTRSIHHYDASWVGKEEQLAYQVTVKMNRRFGHKVGKKLGQLYSLPFRIKRKIKQKGIWGTICFAVTKLRNR